MTPLEAHLKAVIARSGPVTMADYMALCLGHPEHGYYATRDPLGVAGDFTTAPEISQMFGELLGLSLAQHWQESGTPGTFVLAELGPGRGTMMADILRATRGVAGFHDAASVHLVDTSVPLRAVQRETLAGVDVAWHDRVAALPDAPLFLVANEFFDALPVRQFRREAGEAWSERVVGLKDDTLILGQSAPAPVGALTDRLADTREGDIVETCAPGTAVAGEIAARIAARGGAAIVIDYGDWRSLGDTLQAVQGHARADVLAAPGQSDLTAHVDFEALAAAARDHGAVHSRLTPQGVFLERLGITPRAEALARALSGPALEAHVAAHRRLTHPAEMGNLFKVMSIHARQTISPPGLEP